MAFYSYQYSYVDQETRAQHRDEHLAYLTGLIEQRKVVLGGPWADQQGAQIIYRADDLAAAQRMVDDDPYTKAGVSKDRTLQEWAAGLGDPAVLEA